MRRVVAVLFLSAVLFLLGALGLASLAPAPAAAPAAAARPAAPAAATADEHVQPQDDDDQDEDGDEAGREEPKPLAARSILVTLAVILAGGFAVVLAGLGYFSPDRG